MNATLLHKQRIPLRGLPPSATFDTGSTRMESELITVPALARRWGLAPATIYNHVARGRLPVLVQQFGTVKHYAIEMRVVLEVEAAGGLAPLPHARRALVPRTRGPIA